MSQCDERALSPFFDDRLVFALTREGRTVRTTVPACVFLDGYDQTLFEESSGTRRKVLRANIRVRDLPSGLSVQLGDEIETDSGNRYRVKSADLVGGMYDIEAREAAKC